MKRYRRQSEGQSEDDDFTPYISVKERRKQKLVKLGRITEIKVIIIIMGIILKQ